VRVALAGCSAEADPDGPALLAALQQRGIFAEQHPWDSGADWSSYDLVVVRSTWDYIDRQGEFLSWADTVPRLANPAAVLRWNIDKHYLGELAAAGVPVVPTSYVTGDWDPPSGEFVVKPTVSAGAMDTARYRPGQHGEARAHAARLLACGKGVMVQPYVDAVDEAGETSLLFVGGEFSHGARKGPVLAGARARSLTRADTHRSARPDAAGACGGAASLAAAPGPLLYARVDLLPGPDGPLLLELELAEPFFFLSTSVGAADRFAAAIIGWLGDQE